MRRISADYQQDKLEYLKNPLVAEFLGLYSSIDMTETPLESVILSNLRKFLTEFTKGLYPSIKTSETNKLKTET